MELLSFNEFVNESRRHNFKFSKEEKITEIKNLKNLPKELKEIAYPLVQYVTHAKKGRVTGLSLHPDLKKKIREKNLPDGFYMGIDKDGFFVHTHRARCKSFPSPEKIGVKEIRFIDSTG
jgi:hypothetical protein